MTEPIHCPHCGPGQSMVDAYVNPYGYWTVGCGACGSHSGAIHPNHHADARERVVLSWNRRGGCDELPPEDVARNIAASTAWRERGGPKLSDAELSRLADLIRGAIAARMDCT